MLPFKSSNPQPGYRGKDQFFQVYILSASFALSSICLHFTSKASSTVEFSFTTNEENPLDSLSSDQISVDSKLASLDNRRIKSPYDSWMINEMERRELVLWRPGYDNGQIYRQLVDIRMPVQSDRLLISSFSEALIKIDDFEGISNEAERTQRGRQSITL